MIMIRRSLIVFIMFLSLGLKAQDKVDKLTFLFIDGKYEKCVKLGERYSHKSDLRHNSGIYLNLAKSYFALSQKKGIEDEYKRAFGNSLKNASKFVRYDKKYNDSKDIGLNQAFLESLRDSIYYQAKLLGMHDEYYKASFNLAKIIDFFPDDPVVKLITGAYQMKAHNMRDGLNNIKEAFEKIKPGYNPPIGEEQVLYNGISLYNEIINDPKFERSFKIVNYEVSASDKAEVLQMMKEFKALISEKKTSSGSKSKSTRDVKYNKFESKPDK